MRRSVSRGKIQEETPDADRIFMRHYSDITLRIIRLMQQKGYTQKMLAERMNKRPSEINKWLTRNHNLTLRTLAKLEAVLGEPIICFGIGCVLLFGACTNHAKAKAPALDSTVRKVDTLARPEGKKEAEIRFGDCDTITRLFGDKYKLIPDDDDDLPRNP